MSALRLTLLDMFPEPYAASPTLSARLRIETAGPDPVHAIALRAQVRLEPQRRGYGEEEADGLTDLFGPRERWASTLRPFPWMECSTLVQGFTETTEVDLPMPCTYDFEVAGSRYLHALAEGAIPLVLLFSGTVFTRGATGFGVEQIPWDRECRYEMPVAVSRELVAQSFPASGWLRLDHQTLAMLTAYRAARGLTTYDEAANDLLAVAGEMAR